MDLLAAERVFALRLNTVAIRTETGRPIYSHSGGEGVADILAFPARRISDRMVPMVLWIEAKSTVGRQTPAQVRFEGKVLEEGHHYLLARGSEDVLAWLKQHRY